MPSQANIPVTISIGDAQVTLAPAQRNRTGAPAKYTPEIAARILDELQHGKTLTDICSQDWCASYPVVAAWQANNSAFREAVTRARREGAAAMADQTIDIADAAQPDDRGRVEKDRLRVSARQWLAAKYDSRFADRQIVQHSQSASAGADALADSDIVGLVDQLRRALAQRHAVTIDAEAAPAAHGSSDTGHANPTSDSVPGTESSRDK